MFDISKWYLRNRRRLDEIVVAGWLCYPQWELTYIHTGPQPMLLKESLPIFNDLSSFPSMRTLIEGRVMIEVCV
jgi:hypothetical protein